jgi:hypothetical protein
MHSTSIAQPGGEPFDSTCRCFGFGIQSGEVLKIHMPQQLLDFYGNFLTKIKGALIAGCARRKIGGACI